MNKKSILYIIVVLTGLVQLQSCKKDEFTTSQGVEIITPTGNENYLNMSSDYIFDQNQLHTFEINLPEGALAFLDADPTREDYVEGSLTFNGETISPVNIRYKGSNGAWFNNVNGNIIGSLSGGDEDNPSGHKVATKLSLKIKFDWNGNGATFYGLNKLQLHSQNLDPSQMHERLGYWLYREMGVPAPRSVHARVIINGKYYGVYALTEQIDEAFLAYNFSDGSGNLYKEIWPLNVFNGSGEAQNRCDFLKALKTNTTGIPNTDIIMAFANDIVAASNDTELKAVIEQHMDEDKVIAFTVVDRLVQNIDGILWSCEDPEIASSNFYWYEEPSTNKVHLIPWDMDYGVFETMEYTQAPFGSEGIYQNSAACDKLIGGWALYTQKYDDLKASCLNGPFSVAEANAKIDEWANQIRSATEEAATLHDDAVSITEWEKAIDELKSYLEYARANY